MFVLLINKQIGTMNSNLINAEIEFLRILLDVKEIKETKYINYLNSNNTVVIQVSKKDKIVWFNNYYITNYNIFDLLTEDNNIDIVKSFLSQMTTKHLGYKNYKISI